jgi:hypothetical protein
MRPEEKLELIEEKLDQLSTKQLELIEHHQKQPFYYRWLATPDPKLDATNIAIARLEKDKENYFKVIQAAASVPPPPTLAPEKDWSKAPFYSKTLKTWNFDYPVDQMGFYLTSLTGIGIISKAFWKTWNMKLAEKAIQQNIADDIDVYLHRSGFPDEKQLLRAMKSRSRHITSAIALGVGLVGVFTTFVQYKNKNRSIK